MSRPEIRPNSALMQQRIGAQLAATAIVQSASASAAAQELVDEAAASVMAAAQDAIENASATVTAAAQEAIDAAVEGDLIATSPSLAHKITTLEDRLAALET